MKRNDVVGAHVFLSKRVSDAGGLKPFITVREIKSVRHKNEDRLHGGGKRIILKYVATQQEEQLITVEENGNSRLSCRVQVPEMQWDGAGQFYFLFVSIILYIKSGTRGTLQEKQLSFLW